MNSPELHEPGCPALEALEAHSEGQPGSAPLAEHLQRCDRCRERLAEIRANNAMLDRLRSLTTGSTDLGGDGGCLAAPDVPGCIMLGEVHRGGQGVVYRALQRETSREVAVKVLLAGAFATPAQQRRFEREAELVAQFRHPGIVTLYESGVTADGRHYLVMEFVHGATLDAYVRSRPDRPLGELLELFRRIAAAVSTAHQRGVIHRDLKPGNILVDAEGEPRILDFGLARGLVPAGESAATLTASAGFIGTLAYASPEHATAPDSIEVRSDVYALGVMLYEAICGQRPYEVEGSLREALNAIASAPPRPMRSACGRVDRDLETIVRTAMAKEKDRRYASAAAFERDLGHYLAGEPIDARRDHVWYVLRKTMARHKLRAATAGAFLLLLVASLMVVVILYRRAVAEADKLAKVNLFLEDTIGTVESPRGGDVAVHDLLDEADHWIDLVLHDEPEVAAAVRTIVGNGYRNLDRFDEAERHLRAALELRRARWGEDHPEFARGLNALGLLALDRGRADEAGSLFRRALEIRLRRLGTDHIDIAYSQSNLARAMQAEGDLPEAERLLRDSLALRRRLRGEAHPDVAMALYSLAQVELAAGRVADAVANHLEALRLRRAALPLAHPDRSRSLVATGLALLCMGAADRAEPLLREALAARRAALPNGHWRIDEVASALAEALLALGSVDEAESLLHDCAARLGEPRVAGKPLEPAARAALRDDTLLRLDQLDRLRRTSVGSMTWPEGRGPCARAAR
jgi:tetratricopeptide (TPR) repeat protein/predicted Ser/Thr protein kinase